VFEYLKDRTQWNQVVATLPNAHVFQSWEWGDFKRRWGWTVDRLLWQQDDTPVGAAQILSRNIPYTPWCFMYVSKGPVLDYARGDTLTRVLVDLEQFARARSALFIKIDPDVVCQFGEPAEQPADPVGGAVLDTLGQRDWHFSPEQIQFRNTVLIDLQGQPDECLARMKSKWRYNIRYAARKGVDVRRGTKADIPAFYTMYAETATRDNFLIRPEAYYLDVWETFMETGQAEMLLAQVEDQVVAGLLLFVFGGTAWYLYGASSGHYRNYMPNHLLQWEAMQRARALGCSQYDMWGAPDEFDESDRMWGVYRFKQGFGGQVMQGIGAFDYPTHPLFYRLFSTTLPRFRALIRRVKEQK
jgi:peptidoglycan pentaglycine glycine transferase (the first glycine)